MSDTNDRAAAGASAPAQRLLRTMAAARVSFTWLGVRKTLSREQKEQAAQQRFAAALAASEAAARRVSENMRELEACWRAIKNSVKSDAVMAEVTRLRDFAGLIEQRQAELERELCSARNAAEKAAAVMRLAMRDREVIEQLHHRREGAHRLETAREEQKALDELAGRKSASGLSASLNVIPA